jgi:hypothetical protein
VHWFEQHYISPLLSAVEWRSPRGIVPGRRRRGLRVIPPGKKNWLFCQTEIGAERVAVIRSLLVTCRLHGVDPYTYLVDVLQRITGHPASRVADLAPRAWKAKFSHEPVKSDSSGLEWPLTRKRGFLRLGTASSGRSSPLPAPSSTTAREDVERQVTAR